MNTQERSFCITERTSAIIMLAAGLAAATLYCGRVEAQMMLPGSEMTPAGTSSAARPVLEGSELAVAWRDFSVPDGSGGMVSGYLVDRVLRSRETGTLIFAQRVVLNKGSSGAAAPAEWTRSGFSEVSVDADYLTDEAGSLAAGSMQRLATGNELRFKMARPLIAGEWTYSHVALTNATDFDETGKAILRGAGLAAVNLPAYRPAGTPQPYYTVTPLGYASSFAPYLNDRGQISLTAGDASGFKALLWQPRVRNGTDGLPYAIPKLPGFRFNQGMRINNRGQIVGTNFNRGDRIGDGTSQGFLWTPRRPNGTSGTATGLDPFPGGTHSVAWAINDARQIVGASDLPGAGLGADGIPSSQPTLWQRGVPHEIADAEFGSGYAINRHGAIAGVGAFTARTYQGMIWTPSVSNGIAGTARNVAEVGGPDYQGPGVTQDINDRGEAVGSALFDWDPVAATGGERHGYLWSGATVTDLGAGELPGAINNAGVAVGGTGVTTGALYRNGIRTHLRHFVSPAEGWWVGATADINEREQLVGFGWSPANGNSLILMTPVHIDRIALGRVAAGRAARLQVRGTGFLRGAVVLWNGSPLPTRRVHSNLLRARVPPALLDASGERSVLIANPDGTVSNVIH